MPRTPKTLARTLKTLHSEYLRGRRNAEQLITDWLECEFDAAPSDYLEKHLKVARTLATSPLSDELARSYHRGFVDHLTQAMGVADQLASM